VGPATNTSPRARKLAVEAPGAGGCCSVGACHSPPFAGEGPGLWSDTARWPTAPPSMREAGAGGAARLLFTGAAH
jgi:hypothetical protein